MIRLALFVLSTLWIALPSSAQGYSDYVNPFIGTGAVNDGLSGNNYPGATVPFGMVQVSPDTQWAPDWDKASGYDYNDTHIVGFTHTRLSGTGASDLIDISLFPTTGTANSSRFSHDNESARPGYYRVMLSDEGIEAELSATTRVGIHRYKATQGGDVRLWVDLDRSSNKGSWGRKIINSQLRQVSPTAIEGYRIITGWAKLRKVCFRIEFSQPIAAMTLSDGGRTHLSATVINGTAVKGLISFVGNPKELTCKVAISPLSIENARENMLAEAQQWQIEDYVASATKAWDKELGRIEVVGDKERMTTFYTALYHTMIQPNTFSDVNGEYMTADYSVGRLPKGEKHYTTFSLWDTYRAAHPLYTILDTERTKDFVNSMLRHYDAYGYLPIWQLWGQDNYCMIGNHAIAVIADAVLKGIEGIDVEHAYEAVVKTSTIDHPNSPWTVWEKHGYMPEDLQTQSVSITLELAFDDWCVAQMAKHLGKTADYEHFSKRAEYYRNLHNADTHFFQSRNSKGEWIEPFDALKYGANGGYPFTEGNAWQYYWYVPHNVDALVELTGGKKAFEKKLDDFFTITDTSGAKNDNISGLIGQYAHGNEPSHHVAYLYNAIGKPEKTQDMVWRIMTQLYNNTSSGYAGNDDCGEMSAWYVMSAMGFYPVNPASGEYYIGTPLFDRCTIHLPNGNDFTVTAKRRNADSHRVKSITLNGKKLNIAKKDGFILTHDAIVGGGTMEFRLR